MNKFIILLGLITFVSSCTDKSIVYEDNVILGKESWNRKTPQKFSFEVSDTTIDHELSYIIRNIHNYPYSNLYLKYTLTDNEEQIVSSNFQDVLLYNPKSGDPLGKTEMLNDAQTGRYPFAKLKFKSLGTHHFSVIHQMRDTENLDGLESIGLQIKEISVD